MHMSADRLNATAKQSIARHSMINTGDGIVVGVSGGPDSVALLLFLHEIAFEYDLRLHIAHVNHMIRGADADEDAHYVEKLGCSLGVPVTIERVDVPRAARKSGATVEDAGRSARYGLFLRTAMALGFNKVAVGHNADDQAETVLMRVIRGAGARGLSGIPPVRDLGHGVTLVRPLIGTTREAIEVYCRAHDVHPRQDATNLDTVYFRNRVRRELLPLLESNYNSNIRASLVRLAAVAGDDEAYLQSAAGEVLERATVQDGAVVCLDLAILRNAPPALLARVLTAAFAEAAGDEQDLYYSHVIAMSDLVIGGAVGDSIDLPHGVRAWLTYDRLLVGQSGEADISPSANEACCECEHGRDGQGVEDCIGAGASVKLRVPGITEVSACEMTVYSAVAEADELATSSVETALEAPNPANLAELGSRVCAASGFPDMWLDPARIGKGWVIFDAEEIGMEELTVRPWQAGDRLAPFGMKGTKKVSDIFIDDKIPKADRYRWPVVVHRDEVVWVVGLRASGIAPVSEKTRRCGVLVAELNCLDQEWL